MQVTHKKGIEDNGGNMFSELLYRYLPYWPLFLVLFIVFGFGAWFYLRYASPVYETSATILVKDEKKGVDDSNLMEQLDLFGSKKLVENEIEIIKSRMLMHEVVENLSLYAPITYKGRIKSKSAYVFSPVTIQVRNPDKLIPEKKVFFTYDSLKKEVTVNGQQHPLNQWFSDSVNDIRFIPNPNYEAPKEDKPLFYSMVFVKKVTDELLDALKVSQATKLSAVIDLKLRDPVPQRSEDILNNLINVYNKAAVNDKNALASNTLKFINERLGLVVSELDSVELGIQKYKTRQGIVDISAQGQLYLDNVGANDQKLSEINVQLAVMDQVENYVSSQSDKPGIVPSTFGVADPQLTQSLGKLYDLEVQYEGLRKTTAENNPIAISLRNEIDKMKPSILENIRSLRRNLEAGKGNLSGTSNRYASILQRLPQKERGLVEISRQQSIKNGIYSFLLQKREETALSYNSAVADTRIVDHAESGVNPVSPKHTLIYLVAIIAALGAGAGLVAIREVFNQNIVFRSEIEQYTAVPVIGEIMQEASKESPFVIEEGRRTFIAEQFRQLRTSLAYIGINNRKKKILVTSTISAEGKSFISANLAISLALTNKKVVLLELDLRKPRLSNLFNVSREVGLTNYFIGNKEADHIIKSTEVNNNLFIIPSGAIPPNPSELILNGRLEELLKYLDTIFDYIIMDTAPVSPVTDAYLISPMSDATLYVVRHGVTPKMFIKKMDENTRMTALKNMAIVFNGVKSRGMGANTYGYGYGYGNTNSYGYGDFDDKSTKKGKRTKKSIPGEP
ncbi:MAG TPA: polysaccharide biosynthesis tyrosine autokinase [Puia sp.]|jgi:capsular exopolysaccharide synthesis family protein|nr:polysaccharide biosynthesis tyrosine autokinase [Puia sp.]